MSEREERSEQRGGVGLTRRRGTALRYPSAVTEEEAQRERRESEGWEGGWTREKGKGERRKSEKGGGVVPYLLTNCRNFDYRRSYVPACARKYILPPRLLRCASMFCTCMRVRLDERA